MMKIEFLSAIRERLSGLPEEDIENSIEYYSEIIDDRIEEGLSEREAVEAIGTVDEITSNILADTSLSKLVKAKVSSRRALKIWEIVLLVLGSPVWLSILIAIFAVILSVYIVLWSGVIVLYAVMLAFGICALAGIIGMVWLFAEGRLSHGIMFFGVGMIFAGLTVLSFFAANLAAKGVAVLGKKILLGIKFCFVGKEKKA